MAGSLQSTSTFLVGVPAPGVHDCQQRMKSQLPLSQFLCYSDSKDGACHLLVTAVPSLNCPFLVRHEVSRQCLGSKSVCASEHELRFVLESRYLLSSATQPHTAAALRLSLPGCVEPHPMEAISFLSLNSSPGWSPLLPVKCLCD